MADRTVDGKPHPWLRRHVFTDEQLAALLDAAIAATGPAPRTEMDLILARLKRGDRRS